MKILGITGPSGAGKTTITEILKNTYNSYIINADKVARILSNDNQTEYFKEIVNLFGNEIVKDDDGQLDRKMIANKIYNDNQKRENLNELTFKYVVEEIHRLIENAKKLEFDYIVIDAPLLYEAKLEKKCDYVIAVIANYKEKIFRICQRDGISKETARQRLEIQKSNDFFEKNADFVIYNDTSLEKLENSLKEIIERI